MRWFCSGRETLATTGHCWLVSASRQRGATGWSGQRTPASPRQQSAICLKDSLWTTQHQGTSKIWVIHWHWQRVVPGLKQDGLPEYNHVSAHPTLQLFWSVLPVKGGKEQASWTQMQFLQTKNNNFKKRKTEPKGWQFKSHWLQTRQGNKQNKVT